MFYPGGLQKLQEGVDQKLEDNIAQTSKLKEHKKSYQTLEERLTTLPDKISHDVIVPFTKKAFMPGKLIHTNEIQVLLGDNYFLECSAKHAKEICTRRIKHCDQMLKELETEMKLVEGWQTQTNQLKQDQDQCQDITEHFTEQQLTDWRKKHKQSVIKEKNKEKLQKQKEIKTDDDLWQRLEELEVREALEKEWEQMSDDSEDSDDEDESEDEEQPDEVDDGIVQDAEGDIEENEEEGIIDQDSYKENKNQENDSDDGSEKENDDAIEIVDQELFRQQKLKRRVSFAAKDDENVIRFSHSNNESEKLTDSEYPSHPGDLSNSYLLKENSPKSILKVPDGYDPSEHIIPEPKPEERQPPQPFINPVQDLVQESVEPVTSDKIVENKVFASAVIEKTVNISETSKPENPPKENAPKKVSKFKAMRAQQLS